MAFVVEHTLFAGESRVLAGRPVRAYRNAVGVGLLVVQGNISTVEFAEHRARYTVVQTPGMIPDDIMFLDFVVPQGLATLHAVYGERTQEETWKD